MDAGRGPAAGFRALKGALCHLDDLPDGAAKGFGSFFIVRRGGVVFGYEDRCPHYGDTPLAWRSDAYMSGDGAHIACHAHGALFVIETGECLAGPCLGQRLLPIRLLLRGDGWIFRLP